MEHELPNEFELIVIGTGMIESIVAAAASRIGKKVLHIDSNDYYGGMWASFNIEGIDKHITNAKKHLQSKIIHSNQFASEGEQILDIGNDICSISNIIQQWYIPKEVPVKELKSKDEKVSSVVEKIQDIESTQEIKSQCKDIEIEAGDLQKTEKVKDDGELKCQENKLKIEIDDGVWTQDKIMKSCRKFNIDLAPKLQFARGEFVELLISSNIARYSEYRSITRVLTWLNGQLEVVPCSRSDVFSNTKVSVVEKRMLMKLLSTCMDGDEVQFADYENKTFLNYLKDKKLTPNLIHYVLYAIAMCTDDSLYLEGVENTKRFLNSLGRFGKTPFLFSMYGSGELPQAFCRLCAVFGGTYCLNRSVSSLVLNSQNKCTSVICGDQRISSDHFVISVENIPEKYALQWKPQKISRAVFIIDKSVFPGEKENLTLLLFPPQNGKNPITIIELGPATGTCPQELYILHMYCKQLSNPKEDFEHCMQNLLNMSLVTDLPIETNEENCKPNVLWSMYYTVSDTSDCKITDGLPENIYPCSEPDLDLDYDNSIRKAKNIFLKIYPESEFLPRAPDPEEIIICDEDEDQNKTDPPVQDANKEQENEDDKKEKNE